MAITKQDIDNVSLNIVNEGYDPEEVDVLLERIADEVDSFNRALIEAAARVEAAETRAQAAEHQAAQSAQLAHSAQASQQAAASEHQIAQVLIAAQKSADDLRDAARIESEKAYREAEQRARDIVRDALAEKQRIIDEIERLRNSTEKFRSEYMSVLSRFTSEAQKAMPTLEENTPDISKDKKATDEAIKVLKEGDASFEAPEKEPEPAASAAQSPFSSFQAEKPAASPSVVTSSVQQSPVAVPSQASFGFDDDLDIDIEEID